MLPANRSPSIITLRSEPRRRWLPNIIRFTCKQREQAVTPKLLYRLELQPWSGQWRKASLVWLRMYFEKLLGFPQKIKWKTNCLRMMRLLGKVRPLKPAHCNSGRVNRGLNSLKRVVIIDGAVAVTG